MLDGNLFCLCILDFDISVKIVSCYLVVIKGDCIDLVVMFWKCVKVVIFGNILYFGGGIIIVRYYDVIFDF